MQNPDVKIPGSVSSITSPVCASSRSSNGLRTAERRGICRMHRLIQAVVKQRTGSDLPALETAVMEMVMERARFLQEGVARLEQPVEIHPLSAFAWQAMDTNSTDASLLATIAGGCLQRAGRLR